MRRRPSGARAVRHERAASRVAASTRRYPLPKDSLFERKRFTTALEDADIDVAEGEAVGIIGESGSGKSTLVRLLLALDTPTAGTVAFDGRPVDAAASARALHWLRRETGHRVPGSVRVARSRG